MGSSATIRFCTVPGGSRVAWASMGEGPPLVMVPGWICHVEDMWSHPSAASARDKFAAKHRFVWYDRLGCGLSDRDGFEPSIENDVEQLVAVLAAADIERCDLVGYSFGGPPAAVFAARNPQRVDRLVLYSTWARGTALASEESHRSMRELIRANWALGTKTLATLFIPNGRGEDLNWFSRFQRRAARAEDAIRLWDYLREQDVSDVLPSLRVPTLVLTNRRDPAVHPNNSRELASLIPGSFLHMLEGNEHEPFIRDSGSVVEAILDFVEGRPIAPAAVPSAPVEPLTPREREVLRLIAEGESNKAIASRLGIQVATVERHVANIYAKLGARGRADAAMHAVALRLVPVPAS